MTEVLIFEQLLELGRVAARTTYIEFVLVDQDTNSLYDIWLGNGIRVATGLTPDQTTVATTAPEVVVVPVTGPSAETGWVAATQPDSDGASTRETLEGIARLIEDRLDRQAEQVRLDHLGELLRSNQDRLRHARDQLELSNRELEQFAYIAAHELVAPLRAVAVYAEILETVAPIPELEGAAGARDCVNEIRSGVQRMTQQVQYLLALSRTQLDTESAVPVAVNSIVEAALDSLADALAEIDGEVTVGELPTVMATVVPLQSVFANLFTNAIRYRSPDRPLRIEVNATETNGGHRIEVVDNGEGIKPEDHARVFQMFERATETEAGSGIGLALSRRILDVFDASIGVEAGAENGSIFWLQFPFMVTETDNPQPTINL